MCGYSKKKFQSKFYYQPLGYYQTLEQHALVIIKHWNDIHLDKKSLINS